MMPAQKKNKCQAKAKATSSSSTGSSSNAKANTQPTNRAPTDEAIVKSVLQNPALNVVIAGYLDRKDLLTLPRLAKWVNPNDHDEAWRGLFERHWLRKWFREATAAVAAGGTTWKQQYKRRHEENSTGMGLVSKVDSALSFTRGGGSSVEGWKDGSWSMHVSEGDDDFDMHDMTEAESKLIHVNKGKLRYTDFQVDPSGGEVPPDSDVVQRGEDYFISPKGYFTVREVLHIVLHRYTGNGKNAKRAARLVGDHVFYEGAVGMNFGWGGWGS